MKIAAIVQARTSSTRLPKKVLKELPYGRGITVLQQVIRRLKKSTYINEVIIATTKEKKDDKIIQISKKEQVNCFRGSKDDVLSRYYMAAKEINVDIIVRITSDCPCIDPAIVDLVIKKHLKSKADYTTNILKRTFPHGLDTEVINFSAIKKAHNEAKQKFEREHVTPYVYRSGKFKVQNVNAPKHLKWPDIRITLDTKEDYALLCAVYDFLYARNNYFGAEEIIKLFNKRPWLSYINEDVVQKKIFNSLKDELKEAERILGLQDFKRARDFITAHLNKI